MFATLQCTEFLLSSYCVGRAFHIHIIIVLFTNCVHHDLFYIILIYYVLLVESVNIPVMLPKMDSKG